MLRYIFPLALLLAFNQLSAQEQAEDLNKPTLPVKSMLSLDADVQYLSNSMTAAMFNAFTGLNGLNQAAIASVKPMDDNALLMDNSLKLSYFGLKKKEGFAWSGFQLGYRQVFSSRYSNQMYNLAFHGNAAFEDETAVLHPFSLQSQSYASIHANLQYSYSYKEDKSANLIFSLQPGLLLGRDYYSLYLNQGSLYTAPYGEYLDLQADYAWQASRGSLASGIGMGLHAQIQWVPKPGWLVRAGVQNLGIIYWSNRAEQVSADTSLHFAGIDFPEIHDIASFQADSSLDVSIMNALYYERIKNESFTSGTSPSVSLTVSRYFARKRVHISFLSKQFLTHPLLNASELLILFRPVRKLQLSVTPGLIAFQRPYLNLGASIQVGKLVVISLEAGDVISFANPESSNYQRLAFSVKYLY